MSHLYHDETPPDVEPVCERQRVPAVPGKTGSMPGMRFGSRRDVR